MTIFYLTFAVLLMAATLVGGALFLGVGFLLVRSALASKRLKQIAATAAPLAQLATINPFDGLDDRELEILQNAFTRKRSSELAESAKAKISDALEFVGDSPVPPKPLKK